MRPLTRREHSLTSRPHHPKPPWVQWAPPQCHLRHNLYSRFDQDAYFKTRSSTNPSLTTLIWGTCTLPLQSPIGNWSIFKWTPYTAPELVESRLVPANGYRFSSEADTDVGSLALLENAYALRSYIEIKLKSDNTLSARISSCTMQQWRVPSSARTLWSKLVLRNRSPQRSVIECSLAKTW